MEYICEIIRNPEVTDYWKFISPMSVRLPLFDCFPKSVGRIVNDGDFIIFMVEDRHTPDFIGIYPPKELSEDQMKLINDKWDYCVNNGINKLKFEL